MKNFYPIQVFDLRFQVDHVNLTKIQLFEENRGKTHNDHRNVILFAILTEHRETEMASDEFKTQIKDKWNDS